VWGKCTHRYLYTIPSSDAISLLVSSKMEVGEEEGEGDHGWWSGFFFICSTSGTQGSGSRD